MWARVAGCPLACVWDTQATAVRAFLLSSVDKDSMILSVYTKTPFGRAVDVSLDMF